MPVRNIMPFGTSYIYGEDKKKGRPKVTQVTPRAARTAIAGLLPGEPPEVRTTPYQPLPSHGMPGEYKPEVGRRYFNTMERPEAPPVINPISGVPMDTVRTRSPLATYAVNPISLGAMPTKGTAAAEQGGTEGFFANFISGIGRAFKENPDQMAYFLGQIGQAVMGQHQETWQAKLGGAGSEMAQKRAHGRYMKAIIAGEEPSGADVSILTPEQQLQGTQMGMMLETQRAETDLAKEKLELEKAKVEAQKSQFGKELGFKEKTTPTVEQQLAESEADRKNRLAIAGINEAASLELRKAYINRYTADAGAEEKTAKAEAAGKLFDRALKVATEVASFYEENPDMAAQKFNEQMKLLIPDWEGISAEAGAGKSADLELLGL